jgi:hypothetical protein
MTESRFRAKLSGEYSVLLTVGEAMPRAVVIISELSTRHYFLLPPLRHKFPNTQKGTNQKAKHCFERGYFGLSATMYEDLNTVLSAELVSLSPKQQFFISLLILFVIPSIHVILLKYLPASSIKHLFLVPAGQVFVVEFLFRPSSISVSRVVVTCLVVAVSVTVYTSLII